MLQICASVAQSAHNAADSTRRCCYSREALMVSVRAATAVRSLQEATAGGINCHTVPGQRRVQHRVTAAGKPWCACADAAHAPLQAALAERLLDNTSGARQATQLNSQSASACTKLQLLTACCADVALATNQLLTAQCVLSSSATHCEVVGTLPCFERVEVNPIEGWHREVDPKCHLLLAGSWCLGCAGRRVLGRQPLQQHAEHWLACHRSSGVDRCIMLIGHHARRWC